MDIQHGHEHYWTTRVEDRKGGSVGYQLLRERFGQTVAVAQTTFWDAAGSFHFNTFNSEDVPVEIVEAAIREAREQIKVR